MSFEERVLLCAQQVECLAMIRRRAVLCNGNPVCAGGIPFVFVPVVLRELFVQIHHVIVPICFGKNRSCGDREKSSVAFYFTRIRYVVVGGETVSVDEQCFGTSTQSVEGAMHGEKRGIQNIDFVDFFRCYDTYGPCDGILFDDGAQGITLFFGESF